VSPEGRRRARDGVEGDGGRPAHERARTDTSA
jgi:hypothetical protein